MDTELAKSLAALDTEAPLSTLLDLRGVIQARIAELRGMLMVLDNDHLGPALARCGGVTVGDKLIVYAVEKETKPTDVVGAFRALLAAVQGDEEQFVAALRSDPFKPSVAKQLLPPGEYGRLFVTTERGGVREKPAPKKVQIIDRRFIEGATV